MTRPSRLIVRAAHLADYASVAELFHELETGDLPPDMERFENEMLAGTWVAEQEGLVIGYVWAQPLETAGYVRHVVTAPSVRGTGVGRALMDAVAQRLRGAGCTSWCLNVKPDNVPALRLYESFGMKPAFRSWALGFPWDLLSHVELRGELVVRRIDSQELERELEAAFGLPAGQLSRARTMPARVLLGAWEAGEPAGLVCFDPTFPGAFPFRARNLEVARLLVDECARHARVGTPRMQLVVEGQDELARQLLDAGARLRLEILHYEGLLG